MPKKKLKTSDAQARARDKYDSNYRRLTIRLAPEISERIELTGLSINAFVNRAVLNELNRIEQEK